LNKNAKDTLKCKGLKKLAR